MRESFGGLFMMVLLLIILTVVVAFAAIGLSIGKTFRVKNQIISYLEEYEGCDISTGNNSGKAGICNDIVGDKINEYLTNTGYNNGYSVRMLDSKRGKGYYYEVTVYATWYLPFVSSNNRSVFSSSSSNGTGGSFSIRGKTDLVKRGVS